MIFIALHGTNGQLYYVNPQQITSLRGPLKDDLERFPKGTRCVVVTVEGKFMAVVEECTAVRDIIAATPKD